MELKHCPLRATDDKNVDMRCFESCAWNIAGECAVVSIANSLAEPDPLPIYDLVEAVKHVSMAINRKVI